MSIHPEYPGQVRYLVEVSTTVTTPFVVMAANEEDAREQVLSGVAERGDSSFSEPEVTRCIRMDA